MATVMLSLAAVLFSAIFVGLYNLTHEWIARYYPILALFVGLCWLTGAVMWLAGP